jgi:aspartate aminotransferase-like enzyme
MLRLKFWLRRPSPCCRSRSKDFEAIFRGSEEKAKQLFYTQYRVFQAASSGSECRRRGIRNFVQTDVLSCVNGAFAQRWYDVAIANGKNADKLEVEFGEAITPDLLRAALQKKHYEAVTIVHNETSTGVENPLADLCKVIQEVSPDICFGGCGFFTGWVSD